MVVARQFHRLVLLGVLAGAVTAGAVVAARRRRRLVDQLTATSRVATVLTTARDRSRSWVAASAVDAPTNGHDPVGTSASTSPVEPPAATVPVVTAPIATASSTRPATTATGSTESAPTGEVAILGDQMDEWLRARDVSRTDADGDLSATVLAAPAATSRIPSATVPPSGYRLSGATLAAMAAVAGVAAVGLGSWAFVQSVRTADKPESSAAASNVERVVTLLSKPTTERIPLTNVVGRIMLVVGDKGYGVLVLDGLDEAPTGKSYQAWVIRPKAAAPVSAAVFDGREVAVPLKTLVPAGATVAITIEQAGGVPAPTQAPKITAQRSA